LGKGIISYWINERDFIVFGSTSSCKGTIDSQSLSKFGGDSLFAIPAIDEKYIIIFDDHKGSEGWFISPTASYKSVGIAGARKLIQGNVLVNFIRGGREMYYVAPGTNDLHRITLPDGKDKILRTIPGLKLSSSVRQDGKEIAFTEITRKTRFMVLEDVFK
jgi:hypothetical protein